MKLIREDNDTVNTIHFLFVGMLEETPEHGEGFIVAVYAEADNETKLPVISRMIREFLWASRFLVRSAEEIICAPHTLPHPKPCDFRIPKNESLRGWDDVEKALTEYTRKHTEGFKIICERSPKCEEFITADNENTE